MMVHVMLEDLGDDPAEFMVSGPDATSLLRANAVGHTVRARAPGGKLRASIGVLRVASPLGRVVVVEEYENPGRAPLAWCPGDTLEYSEGEA